MKDAIVRVTDKQALCMIQLLTTEKGKKYEDRRKRRRIADALGLRKDVHYSIVQDETDPDKAFLKTGRVFDGKFKVAEKLGPRKATLNEEALDYLIKAAEERGDKVGDEDTLLDLENLWKKIKDGKYDPAEEDRELPGVDEPSPEDKFEED